MRTRVIIRKFFIPISVKKEKRIHFTILLPPDVIEVIEVDATTSVYAGYGIRHVEAARISLRAAGVLVCDFAVRAEGKDANFAVKGSPSAMENGWQAQRMSKRQRLTICVPGEAGVVSGYVLNNIEIAPAYTVTLYLYYHANEKP